MDKQRNKSRLRIIEINTLYHALRGFKVNNIVKNELNILQYTRKTHEIKVLPQEFC